MAKKLNKKVAIIGSLVLAVLIMVVIVAVLKMTKNPEPYLLDARKALALDEPDYKTAKESYGHAFSYTKETQGKIDILFELADMYTEMNEWQKVAGCWNKVINYDPQNLKARLALLDYTYKLADSGNWTVWKEVKTNTTELIEKELDTSNKINRIKGRAILELVKHGQETDAQTAINEAIDIFRQVNTDEPNNVDVYQYLADAVVQKGKMLAASGVLGAEENARQEASKILLDGVNNLPDEPKAYINLYSNKMAQVPRDSEQHKEVESDILELTEQFPESPLPYVALVQIYRASATIVDKAIAAAERATQLDSQNVSYAITLADLLYRRSAVAGNEKDFDRAVSIATEALSYPESLDIPGPRARVSFLNRYSLHTFLATCYIDKSLNLADDSAEKAEFIEKSESEVYQIDQLLGSAENPYAIMWQGRILLAKGQRDEAVVRLNAAYELLEASAQQRGDPQFGLLAYELGRVFQNTSEAGAVIKYYTVALKNAVHTAKPDLLLDFAAVLMRVKDFAHAVELVDFFETNYDKTDQSSMIRLKAYIGANMIDKAQALIAEQANQNLPQLLRLRLELLNKQITQAGWQKAQAAKQDSEKSKELESEYEKIKAERTDVLQKIENLDFSKKAASDVVALCKWYLSEGKVQKIRDLTNKFIEDEPSFVDARLYGLLADEPNVSDISSERIKELTVKAIELVPDAVQKAQLFGRFYLNNGQSSEAVKYYKQALELGADDDLGIIAGLFDSALAEQDFDLAEALIEKAKEANADNCNGNFYKARLAFVQQDYEGVIDLVGECLELRPVFSQAYFLRSQANAALEKADEALSDAQKARSLNPIDGNIAKNVALVLFNRNEKLGSAVTNEQITETKAALGQAIAANPMDINLKSFYASYISDSQPQQAVAMCQQIQQAMPNVENSVRLGDLAFKIASANKAVAQRKTYMAIAEDAYKKALKLEPGNIAVLQSYSRLLIFTNRADEAEALLTGHDELLWRYFAQVGKADRAGKILQALYSDNPKDANTIKGLVYVSRLTQDQAGILKYTDELLNIDNSVDNQIIQIETYLESGIIDDAQKRLAALREKYPDEPRAIFLQTWLLAKKGNLDEAFELANRNLEVDKINPRVWQLRGQINLALNKVNEAIDDLQKSKGLADNGEIRVDLAKAYIRASRTEQAFTELKVAMTDYGSVVARNLLEEIYMKTGKFDNLEKFYAETIELFPEGTYWHNRAGEFALSMKNFEKAFSLFDTSFKNSLKANSTQPNAEAFDGKLRALLEGKKYDQLLAEATKYLDGPLSAVAYSRMANAKADTGDKNAAVQYYRRALEKAGTNQAFIVEILRHMNKVVGYEETVKWCNERLQTQPNSLAVHLALYNLHSINAQHNKALSHIDKCIELSSDNESLQLSYLLSKANLLHTTYSKTGDKAYLQDAVKEYQSVLVKQPMNVAVLNNLAYILASEDMDIKKAAEYAAKAYEALPNNANVLDTYGYVLFESGEIEKAEEYLQRAQQLFERDKVNAPLDVYEHIGWVKEKLGKQQEALSAYNRAMEVVDENVSDEVRNRIAAAIERLSN